MNHDAPLRVGCIGALALSLGVAACGSRLDLGGGESPFTSGAGGNAGAGVSGTGGSMVSVPVAAEDAGNASRPTAALGQHCSVNADCASPQVCAQGRCHATCDPSVGCHQGHRLLPCLTEFAASPVCPLPCDPAWGEDSQFCTRAGQPDDGPPGLYECPAFPLTGPGECFSSGTTCSMVCSTGANTLRQDCDRGVCNCTYNGNLACRCVTTDPPTTCSFCCDF